MDHINLIDCSKQIETGHLKELYESKLKRITATLSYLDRLQIPATVTLHFEKMGHQLHTSVEIETADSQFKEVLVEATKSFNTAS